MPRTGAFLDALEAEGWDFFTGVPCSLLKGVIRRFDDDPRYGYVSAVREDSAVGLAAGAWLAGRRPVVLMQNSGLGVCLNALVSLNAIYEIPSLLVVTWRGEGGKDAPEHIVMGEILMPLLDLVRIPWRVLGKETVAEDVRAVGAAIAEWRTPGAIVVPKGVLDASG
jgi:sulfopyruvate decarboxylase subunit alpha